MPKERESNDASTNKTQIKKDGLTGDREKSVDQPSGSLHKIPYNEKISGH